MILSLLLNITIELIDVKGRKVFEIPNEFKQKGIHIIEWQGIDLNGNQISPGLYFVKLSTEYQHTTVKVSVI